MLNLQFTCVFGRVFPPNTICIDLASMWSGFWEKVLQSYNLSSSFTDCSCYARTRNQRWMMLFFSLSEIFASLQSAIHLKSDISQPHLVLETWEISLIIQDIAAKHLCPFGKKNLAIQLDGDEFSRVMPLPQVGSWEKHQLSIAQMAQQKRFRKCCLQIIKSACFAALCSWKF